MCDLMQADSYIQNEFKEFCAQTSMDIISVECAPEACTLIKGKPRVRGLPSGSRIKGQVTAFGDWPPQHSTGAVTGSKRHHLRQFP